MYSDPVAYFLTFTTYGTWLHGRETGSVDRDHNHFDSPTLPPDAELEARERSQMGQPEYRLDAPRREVVLKTILRVAQHRQWHVWAAHVRSNHVHVVITAKPKPEKVMSDLKAWCSRRLKELLGEPADRERWTRHGSTRYVWKAEELAEKIQYVLDEQGERMAWYCDNSTGAESVSAGIPIQTESVSAGIVVGNNITHQTTAMPALTLSALNCFEMIDDGMAAVLRPKSEVERLRIAGRMWNSARVIVRGAIRTEHPDWSEEQVNHEIARRMSHGVVQ